MKTTLIISLLGFSLLTACSPATITTPPSPTSTGAPSIEPSTTPSPVPPTPAPTETPVPAPRAFTEEFDGTAPYWSLQQMDNGQPASSPGVKSGFLVFDLSAPNQWLSSIYNAQEYSDVRVDAQAGFLSGNDGALGVICRYSKTNGWYEFNIYADQTYMLLYGQWLTEGMASYVPLYQGESEKIRVGGEANQIGLSCQANILTPYINGIQMRKWEEKKFGLTNGEIGISASAFENAPITAGFDWVKVSEP